MNLASVIAVSTAFFAAPLGAQDAERCETELVVLGAGQDAGAPQIGEFKYSGPRLLPSALGLINRKMGTRYLFDATPAITEQLQMLYDLEPSFEAPDGVFLTHAHIGHYFGLAYFGREAASANRIPVFARSRMIEFLRTNGPWKQLVELENIELLKLYDESLIEFSDGLGVSSFPVPHRDEYSETIALKFQTAHKSALYAPDFDGWPDFGTLPESDEENEDYWEMASLYAQLEVVDYAFVDATFWDDNELPGRDMSEIPHPRVTQTMDLLQKLPPEERAKIHFIHYNHTNPISDPTSVESQQVIARGFNVARRGQRFCLD